MTISRMTLRAFLVLGGVALTSVLPAAAQGTTPPAAAEAAPTRALKLPINGVWVDSLDLGRAMGGRIGRPGHAAIFVRAARGSTTPPTPPPIITLGGDGYAHGVSMTPNTELWVALDGHATRFVATVGVDDARKTGRGSVTFEVWVDGVKRLDTGVLKSGQAPRPIAVSLVGARRLALYVTDGGDGAVDDVADWGGAVLTTAAHTATLATMTPPVGPTPVIASASSDAPRLNSPRITGATPGRPFLFRIPASGKEPLTFTSANLPPGVTLDPATGIISGALRQGGHTDVQ
ncbi:MAG TPA: NPCBM/NEW2 domain-containing protein, partial [Gemmatimonadales bacterium]|nr:NPCBM/NEW2 domain-containing protein [Gemmatimonadales bacterium]